MDTREIYEHLGIEKEVYSFCEKALEELKESFQEIDKICEYNQLKVLDAMQQSRVSEAHLFGTTGYGYNDIGRDCLEETYARIFHTESALVRSQIICGTHALSTALFALTRPGEEILCPAGMPYDTLWEVIGIRESVGSLKEYGVSFKCVELLPNGDFDYDGIRKAINDKTSLCEIQRSRGYSERESFSPEKIGELICFIKSIKPDIICMVDNCYGEFTGMKEPSETGADIVVGSLIKNPGGGLAPVGGYIAGRKNLIDRCAFRLTSPGLGKEVGPSLSLNKTFFQGLFLAPRITANALKGAVLASRVYEKLGYKVFPSSVSPRNDIVQAITLGNERAIVAFSRGIQASAPVDSFVTPYPDDMPGYKEKVIMAAGAFVQGSSIELSCDGPIREPYNVYFQGGLTFEHAKFGIMKTVESLKKEGLIELN